MCPLSTDGAILMIFNLSVFSTTFWKCSQPSVIQNPFIRKPRYPDRISRNGHPLSAFVIWKTFSRSQKFQINEGWLYWIFGITILNCFELCPFHIIMLRESGKLNPYPNKNLLILLCSMKLQALHQVAVWAWAVQHRWHHQVMWSAAMIEVACLYRFSNSSKIKVL